MRNPNHIIEIHLETIVVSFIFISLYSYWNDTHCDERPVNSDKDMMHPLQQVSDVPL